MKPVVCIIMDGWGIAPDGPGNAITQAHVTTIPRLWQSYPHTTLDASGLAVGLPENENGNTETGHMNIGAGRIVPQDLVRINTAVENGNFYQNAALLGAIRNAENKRSNIHIMGIFSDAGVHGSKNHLCAILELLKRQHCQNVYLHLFTDGRDSKPKSALHLFEESHTICEAFSFAHIATIMGRYYAMDRDLRWERTETAYKALTDTAPFSAQTVAEAIEKAYARGESDEFIQPTILSDPSHKPYPRVGDNDSVIFFNYRVDRPRQLVRAFVMPNFETEGNVPSFDPYAIKYHHKHVLTVKNRSNPFTRSIVLKNLFFVTMTQYEPELPCVVAFPPETIPIPLAKVLSDAHIRQLRASESEKERFVTYYFNGLREEAYPGEDRLIVPSPNVPTYDLAPEMSALELTQKIIDRLKLDMYGVVVVNFANPDMVGHSGNLAASIVACQTVDACVGKIVDEVLSLDGSCIVTADHGNVEEEITDGVMSTEHSHNPVPCIIVNRRLNGKNISLSHGKLGDIAPTILSLLGIMKPPEMTGNTLLENGLLSTF